MLSFRAFLCRISWPEPFLNLFFRELLYAESMQIFACALIVIAGNAAVITWTGNAGDSSFETAGNWVPVQVPRSNDSVVISAPVTVSATHTVAALYLTGSATISGAGGRGLTTGALAITLSASSAVTMSQ